MKLVDRLKNIGAPTKLSDKQVDALLAGTELVLEALKADLLENESFALETILSLEGALAALPEDMGAVRNMDQKRVIADRLLEGGVDSGSRGAQNRL